MPVLMATENLKIGARGWCHPQWSGSYYPDDLPVEWQLTYYANDFQVVLVPPEYWDLSNGYDLDLWIDAVDDDFRFFLECPNLNASDELPRFQAQCAKLNQLLGGVIVTNDMDEKRLDLDCALIRCDADNYAMVENSFDKRLSPCLDVLGEDFEDLRKVRAWLDIFDKGCQREQKVVFVSNGSKDDIPMETLVKIRTLTQLMGF